MAEQHKLKNILIFDDDADLRKLVSMYLGKLFPDVEVEEYDPLESGAPDENFDWSKYDVLILDYFLCLESVTGLDILHRNRKNIDFPATIMLTGAGNEEVAVKALKAGVYDYLRKQTLNKQQLHDSIIKAFSTHNESQKRKQEASQQGQAFNKSLFYQQLEFHKDLPEYRERVLIQIELDNNRNIAERDGVILRDNIVKYIAKLSFEIFKLGNCNPSVTRLSDAAIALLIDMPDSRKTLEFNMKGLLNSLAKRPYKFHDKKIEFSVSVGVVQLTGEGESRENVLRKVKEACNTAARIEGNAFYIFGSVADTNAGQQPVPAAPSPGPKPIPPETAAPEPQPSGKPALELSPVQEDVPKSAPVAADGPTPAKKPAAPVPPHAARPGPAGVKPKKSLAELKAELEKAKAPEHKPAGKAEPGTADANAPGRTTGSSSADDVEIDETGLDEAAKKLKKAFDEQRIIQAYQPVISFINEDGSEDEMHSISLQQIVEDGTVIYEDEIRQQLNTPEFKKFVDHWLLRQVIGKLSNKQKTTETFILKISDASLADAGFFNWLRKLLTGLGTFNPGKYIVLQIDSSDLESLEKQANALISYLRKSHDFKFVLGEIKSAEDIVKYAGKIKFDLIRCNHKVIKELHSITIPPREPVNDQENVPHSQLDLIKSQGTRFIADDIDNATVLTDAISSGVEFAMGDFIGEPVTQLEDIPNIESFEIV